MRSYHPHGRTFCQPSIPDPVHYSTPVPPSLAAKASPADGVSAPLSRGPDPRRLAAAHRRSPLPLRGRTPALHRLPPPAPPHCSTAPVANTIVQEGGVSDLVLGYALRALSGTSIADVPRLQNKGLNYFIAIFFVFDARV